MPTGGTQEMEMEVRSVDSAAQRQDGPIMSICAAQEAIQMEFTTRPHNGPSGIKSTAITIAGTIRRAKTTSSSMRCTASTSESVSTRITSTTSRRATSNHRHLGMRTRRTSLLISSGLKTLVCRNRPWTNCWRASSLPHLRVLLPLMRTRVLGNGIGRL